MKKVNIIYWSGTGNTLEMAKLIEKGAKDAGQDVKLLEVDSASEKDVEQADVLFLGCPSMGNEELEEGSMEPFVSRIESLVEGKTLGLFGSYGWGNGEWMEDWIGRMEKSGASILGRGCIVNEAPEGDDQQKCIEYGKNI